MSPPQIGCPIQWEGFPRVSGDEPVHREATARALRFSPRERG